MKRRRVENVTRVSEQARPSGVAKHSSSCFPCGKSPEGYVVDSLSIFNALPVEPQVNSEFLEPKALSLACAARPSAICESLAIANLVKFADPCRQFDFTIISTNGSVCWEEVCRKLIITAELEGGHTLPAVSLRAALSFKVLPNDSLRITICPAWWSHATSFTIDGLYHAGQLVNTPLLPATIKVLDVNHAPSKAGRLWLSAIAGDAAGVISAVKDGCSTEESDEKVCIMNVVPSNL